MKDDKIRENEIRNKIINKAAFVVGRVFSEEESPGIERLRTYLKKAFNTDFLNSIDAYVKEKRYGTFIEALMDKDCLMCFFEKLPSDENYQNIGPNLEETLNETISEISDLLKELNAYRKESKEYSREETIHKSVPSSPESDDNRLSFQQIVGGVLVIGGSILFGYALPSKKSDSDN